MVRGGLQAIPRGQYDAAHALALPYWRRTWLIILPQALRISVPPLVNTFIALFKDTSLVLIIGLFDLLSTIKISLTEPAWNGFGIEAYVFASLVYFAFCARCRATARASSADEAPMIEMLKVNKWFGAFHALKDVDLNVGRGEKVVVCASGSGKSTLIRLVNRLEEHQSGGWWSTASSSPTTSAPSTVRREVGMVFQSFNLFPHLTVLENLTLAPIWVQRVARKEAEETAMHFLARVRIPEQAGKYPSHLSGGQQRVAIARALCMKPKRCCSTSRPRRSTRR